MRAIAVLAFVLLALPMTALAQEESEESEPKTIAERVEDMRTLDGLVRVHIDDDAGRVWMELPPPGDAGVVGEFILVESLRQGLGSNPVGLDRSQLGDSRLVRLRVVGGRLLVEQRNVRFRAQSDNPAEIRAVEESFAPSILWTGEIALHDPDTDRLLVDATSFIVRDAHAIATRLRRTGQGDFSLDADRSLAMTEDCLAFPDNIVLEATLTFTSSDPGSEVRAVAVEPSAISFVVRQTLVRLPDDGYQPREWDPRIGCFSISFQDYAADLDEPLIRRWIARHRLEKTNPSAPTSSVQEPIVYYIDRGAPEPVRTALVEGAQWWAEAFEKAGFENAYEVRVAPEEMHPLDVRYNFVQWVHRATRGWSYGGSIVDPRTGEIIKGHVSLGSLRVRQDRLLFEGLAGTEQTGTGAPDDPIQLSLARIRQLSAHEVGHTLGFSHNFAASTWGRASVMDYPAPLVRIERANQLDFSEAYDVGIGEWDIHTVRWAYSDFPAAADEAAELDRVAREGVEAGYVYITDADARSIGDAHPAASLWDNGADPIAALLDTMRVRRIAIDNFGQRNIPIGRPLAYLHEVFVPVYLHHRYQVEAAAKVIGGVEFGYGLRGDDIGTSRPVEAERQRAAIDALFSTIRPEALDVPDSVVRLLLPRPANESPNREMLRGYTGGTFFDPLAAAGVASELVLRAIFDEARLARLAEQRRSGLDVPDLLGLHERLVDQIRPQGAIAGDARSQPLSRVVERIYLDRLMELAERAESGEIRAQAQAALRQWMQLVASRANVLNAPGGWHESSLLYDIDRFLSRPHQPATPDREAPPAPPGSPIGVPAALSGCGHPH